VITFFILFLNLSFSQEQELLAIKLGSAGKYVFENPTLYKNQAKVSIENLRNNYFIDKIAGKVVGTLNFITPDDLLTCVSENIKLNINRQARATISAEAYAVLCGLYGKSYRGDGVNFIRYTKPYSETKSLNFPPSVSDNKQPTEILDVASAPNLQALAQTLDTIQGKGSSATTIDLRTILQNKLSSTCSSTNYYMHSSCNIDCDSEINKRSARCSNRCDNNSVDFFADGVNVPYYVGKNNSIFTQIQQDESKAVDHDCDKDFSSCPPSIGCYKCPPNTTAGQFTCIDKNGCDIFNEYWSPTKNKCFENLCEQRDENCEKKCFNACLSVTTQIDGFLSNLVQNLTANIHYENEFKLIEISIDPKQFKSAAEIKIIDDLIKETSQIQAKIPNTEKCDKIQKQNCISAVEQIIEAIQQAKNKRCKINEYHTGLECIPKVCGICHTNYELSRKYGFITFNIEGKIGTCTHGEIDSFQDELHDNMSAELDTRLNVCIESKGQVSECKIKHEFSTAEIQSMMSLRSYTCADLKANTQTKSKPEAKQ
jgi:hypothetical protein